MEDTIEFRQRMTNQWQGKIVNDQYEISELIGTGSYGDVFLATSIEKPNEKFAVKIMEKKKWRQLESKCVDRLLIEKSMMSKIWHENIVRCHEFHEDLTHWYMILDHCTSGDLEDDINGPKNLKLNEPMAVSYLAQILNGFKLLQWYSIMHRDMKPANILKDDSRKKFIRIADFGGLKLGSQETRSLVGTPFYLAPEMNEVYKASNGHTPNSAKKYDSGVDIFTIGCIFYEMLVGKKL